MATPAISYKVSTATSSSVTVGTSSVTVSATNPDRKAVIIVNDSDTTIYLEYGSGAVLNSGIRLNAAGGSIREEMYTGIITGISASASKNLTVVEL